ncbi:MAG: methionyl-tRNA formyltransferase [Polaromonas sp.]|nr:MAG: methionyl-tRNA formyltransferase [Polaromonas sp.]
MRVIFAGTPEFARVALAKLHTAGFEVPLVLSQPDRPAGRGMKMQQSAVKQWALAQQIAVVQPRSLRLDGKYPDDARWARNAIEAAHADVMVVAAYGLILPQWVLDAPRLGCLNIHASLLPRWRGAAPIHRAIEAGDSHTGVTIMQMDAGLDTGDMLLVEQLAIEPLDTTETLHDRLAALGGRLVVDALKTAVCGGLDRTPQPSKGVIYAHKIEKSEAVIDWTQPAALIERRIRAFQPFPVAVSTLGTEPIKFRAAQVLTLVPPPGAVPGEVLAVSEQGVDICAVNGVIRAVRLQKAGGKPLSVADFLHGFEIRPGMRFDQTAMIKGGL